MIDNFKQAGYFILLILLQVLILNHIFFLGYATPFLYIYFILKLPIQTNKNMVIGLGFLMGLIIDIFCNTPGLNASATTFAAFLRQPVQKLFFSQEDFEHVQIKLSSIGNNFIKYAFVLILLHHAFLISVETFSYFNLTTILLRIGLSFLLTFIIVLAIEGLSIKNKTL